LLKFSSWTSGCLVKTWCQKYAILFYKKDSKEAQMDSNFEFFISSEINQFPSLSKIRFWWLFFRRNMVDNGPRTKQMTDLHSRNPKLTIHITFWLWISNIYLSQFLNFSSQFLAKSCQKLRFLGLNANR